MVKLANSWVIIIRTKEIKEMKESTFKGVSGLKIFTRSWQPEGTTRGVVVIVPGLNSHSGHI